MTEDPRELIGGSLILLVLKFSLNKLAHLVSNTVMLEHFRKVFDLELAGTWFQDRKQLRHELRFDCEPQRNEVLSDLIYSQEALHVNIPCLANYSS